MEGLTSTALESLRTRASVCLMSVTSTKVTTTPFTTLSTVT